VYFHLYGLFLRHDLALVYAKSSIRGEEKEEDFFSRKTEVHLTKKLVKWHIWNIICMVLKTGHLGKKIRNNMKVFKWVLEIDGNDRLDR
jgi:hypothetical protein